MILKQEKERKLIKGSLSGMIPERIGKILVVIVKLRSKNKKSEYSNSGIWDELKFERENSKFTTSRTDKREARNRISHIIGNATYKGKKIVGKGRKNYRQR